MLANKGYLDAALSEGCGDGESDQAAADYDDLGGQLASSGCLYF